MKPLFPGITVSYDPDIIYTGYDGKPTGEYYVAKRVAEKLLKHGVPEDWIEVFWTDVRQAGAFTAMRRWVNLVERKPKVRTDKVGASLLQKELDWLHRDHLEYEFQEGE